MNAQKDDNHNQQTKILLRFSNYLASIFSYLNSYSSSLLSLSRTLSFFMSYLQSLLYISGLYFFKTEPRIRRVSLNLRESLLALSKTVMNFLSYFWQQVAKQGPAVTVTPVFTPINPFLLRSLFVFSQSNYLLMPQLCIQVLYVFVLITLQKSGIFMHQPINKAISQGFDEFRLFGRPWGLAKMDCFRPSLLAYLFMAEIKVLQGGMSSEGGLSKFPPHLARAKAASLPLGSMSPQRRSYMQIKSPRTSSAVVPDISEVSSSILTISARLD